jgi:ABC-type transporter Mla subunit MlaD
MNSPQPIPAPIRELLDLFEQDLADVAFPQVDRQVLSELSDQVNAAFDHLNECQAQLETARAELDEQRAQLLKVAQTAQDYARIYAADDPTLRARVHAIELQPSAAKKTRKTRKPKAKDHTTMPLALAEKESEQVQRSEDAA